MSTHRFRPRLPIRALLLGTGLEVVGAGLAVGLVVATGQPLLWLPGVLLMVVATAVIALALWSVTRNAAEVELGAEGYRVLNRSGEQQGEWRDVSKVTQSLDGDRLTFVHADGRQVHVVAAQGSLAPLVAEVAARMNTSRGYGRA